MFCTLNEYQEIYIYIFVDEHYVLPDSIDIIDDKENPRKKNKFISIIKLFNC